MAKKKTTKKKAIKLPRKKSLHTHTEQSDTHFPVVGVGASAGGIECFIELLEHLPTNTGMAFVLLQHLSSKHKSALAKICQRHTKMHVQQAEDGVQLEPNNVYVIPPNKRMGIVNRRLTLSRRPEPGVMFMPIDFFLRCLAEDQKENALAVILSGSDSDGIEGLRYIKAQGGFALVQDPSTAKMGEMPKQAIASGNIDKILPIAQIAAELAGLGRHPLLIADTHSLNDKAALTRIHQILHARTGVDFSQYKTGTFNRRLKRRLIIQNIDSLNAYVRLLENESEECDELFRDLLINVTSFFRDPEIFEMLKKKIFPKIFEKQPRNIPIRIWVPGCSTGEEAYSIGIALIEAMEENSIRFPVQIFATDLSDHVLNTARQGYYPEGTTAHISAERLARFFKKSPGGYSVNQELRELCVFARHDVTRDPPFSRMDLISCRNLLIYMDAPLQKRVLNTFGYAANPNGYLLLGTSESIISTDRLFAPADKKVRIYTRRALVGRPRTETPQGLSAMHRKLIPKRDLQRADGFAAIEREADRIIIDQFGPPGVIINEQMQIIQFRGRTGEVLENPPGEPDLNLFKMARGGLAQELLVLLKRAKRENAPAIKEGIGSGRWNGTPRLTVGIYPLQLHDDIRYFLVLFSAVTTAAKGAAKAVATAKGKGSFAKTREELIATREYLQSIISDQEAMNEELKTANEEILSSNEELQSSNEELETAKEELQSTNEELTTVNEELANRNTQLARLANDLSNLLASVDMPIVMVGNDLRIRRFTPRAEQVLNLIPSDIGRTITDIKPNLDISDLDKLICDSVDTLTITERKVQDRNGNTYSLRVRPYRTEDDRVDGVVLILVDITARSAKQ